MFPTMFTRPPHKQFSDTELVNLTVAIAAINSWNRVNIAFRTPSGRYRPSARAAKASEPVNA